MIGPLFLMIAPMIELRGCCLSKPSLTPHSSSNLLLLSASISSSFTLSLSHFLSLLPPPTPALFNCRRCVLPCPTSHLFLHLNSNRDCGELDCQRCDHRELSVGGGNVRREKHIRHVRGESVRLSSIPSHPVPCTNSQEHHPHLNQNALLYAYPCIAPLSQACTASLVRVAIFC